MPAARGEAVSAARALARFVAETPLAAIPPAALERAGTALVDTLGAMLGGRRVRAGRIALALAAGSGPGPATLPAEGRGVGLVPAVFANAVLASALDVDDGHCEAVTHPGAVVVPAALAAAEVRHRTGPELLAAVVIGYEVAIRAATVFHGPPRERGYGAGAPGAYGAAASAARLLGLDAARAAHALGITRCHLPVAVLDEIASGAMTKESVGWGAVTGAVAALLAEQGFTGPATALEAPHRGAGSASASLADLGARYRIGEVYVKRFPACLMTHAAVEAALRLRARLGLRPEDVAAVTVWVPRGAADLADPAPDSPEGAQYSLPHTVAAALVDGTLGVEQLLEPRLTDPRIRALAARVEVRHDPWLDGAYPARRPARVTLATRAGEAHAEEVQVVRGSPEDPLTPAEVDAKFLELAAPVVGRAQAATLLRLAREAGERSDLGPLWAALRARPGEPGAAADRG